MQKKKQRKNYKMKMKASQSNTLKILFIWMILTYQKKYKVMHTLEDCLDIIGIS